MIIPILVALIWTAAIERCHAFAARPEQPRGFYTAAVLLIACAFTLNVYPARLDAMPHMANSADLIKHLFAAGTCLSIELYFASLRSRLTWRRAASRLGVFIVVASLITSTWALAPVHWHGAPTNLDQAFGNNDYVAVNRLIFNAYLCWCLIDTVRLCRRHMDRPGNPIRSTGLAIIAASNTIALGYALSRITYLCLAHIGHRDVTLIEHLGDLAALVGLAVLSVGVVWTPTAPWVLRLVHARRLALALRPLWRSLTRLYPETVLTVPWNRDPAYRSEIQLTRRLIEILDCLALVRISAPPAAAVAAADPQHRAFLLGQALHAELAAARHRASRPVADTSCIALALLPAVGSDEELAQALDIARGWRTALRDNAKDISEVHVVAAA